MPFWKIKPLEKMSLEEWESLCDGCGRCCLQKFTDRKTGKVVYTWVSCYLLDTQTCRCTDYAHRKTRVPNCLNLKQQKVIKIRWLPGSCAYRRLAEGKDLEWWHPLVSNDPDAVHKAGISVRDKAISEEFVHPDDVEYYELDINWMSCRRHSENL